MEQRQVLSPGQAGGVGLTPTEIIRRLAARPGGHDRSDTATAIRLAETAEAVPTPLSVPPPQGLVPAAVLVPLVVRDNGFTVLLTQRTAHLAHHAGQISFPGGHMEEVDASPEDAALRETQEEIGLPPQNVQVVGRLDDYITVTGFRVMPVVGLLRPPFSLVPDPFEVADIFEVPLDFILDRRNHQRHFRTTETGQRRYYYALPFHERYIWGATAGMLVNLWEVLSGSCAS